MPTPEAVVMPPSETSDVPPQDVEYSILKPNSYHTSITSQEELLEKYLGKLNFLIEKIVGNENEPGYDTVVFLDKSARPLAWMLGKFWPHMAPQHRDKTTGELVTAPIPSMKFVNVDRLDWRKDPQLEMAEGGMRDVTEEDVYGLRSIFRLRHTDKSSGELSPKPSSELDNKRILIVDEQAETGDTLKIAENLFQKAFPSSVIETTAWIRHPKIGSDAQVKEIPLWYPPKDKNGLHKETGRGVLSPVAFDEDDPDQGDPLRFPPEAYKFMSTKPYVEKENISPEERLQILELTNKARTAKGKEKAEINRQVDKLLREKDPESVQLRREIGQMLLDFVGGRIMPAITSEREEVLGMPFEEYSKKALEVRKSRR